MGNLYYLSLCSKWWRQTVPSGRFRRDEWNAHLVPAGGTGCFGHKPAMSTNDTAAEEADGVQKRTIRAATESMSLDRHAGETGEFDVYSQSGSVYRVNLIDQSCSCPDEEHNAPTDGCKHYRRVEMETGQRSVPDLDQDTDVEMMIDTRADQQAAETDQPEVVTDGGVAVESDQDADQQDQGRPDDCDCSPYFDTDDLGCWPCFRDGYQTANPNASED